MHLNIHLPLFPIAFLALAFAGPLQAAIHLSCGEDNDLHRVMVENRIPMVRHDGPVQAVERAAEGDGVLVLAERYPAAVTEIPLEVYAVAARKRLRLYVEFPGTLPGREIRGIHTAGIYDRAVVTSDFFGGELAAMRVLTLNGCRMVDVDAGTPHMIFAKVAGYNTAAYGLDQTPTRPVLFEAAPDQVLVSTTKLSHFVRGRYGPKAAWQHLWKTILRWADPGLALAGLNWTETVRPMYGPGDSLPKDAVQHAVRLGTDWFSNGRFLVGESWKDLPHHQRATASEFGPRLGEAYPAGDGRFSILEGHSSRIDWDGTQQYRYCRRADCQAESALALALRSKLLGDPGSRAIATNLMDYLYFTSPLRQGPRNDPASGSYGLVSWGAFPESQIHYYGDDNARVFLGSIGTSSLLQSDRWDRSILELILANFRTTGRHGFRGANLVDPDLQRNGWLHYWQSGTVNLHPHFEAWIWTSYLWLYDKVGDKMLLDRTRGAIRRLMSAYPEWNWTNGIQQERARMILTLAWLVRVDDNPEHRAWLKRIVTDVLAHMGKEGAIREEIGREGGGSFGPPRSNAAYGTSETPLIQENGDPSADMLYTMNFAFFGLNEAVRATGDPFYRDALDRMADFLLRIQVRSESHSDLHGAWFRGFDTERWEFWGSNGDHGWGVWGTLTGWTQSWIVSTLVMRELQTSLWDLTKGHPIGRHYREIRERMLPDAAIESVTQRPVRHAGLGAAIQLDPAPDARYPGGGAAGLLDGLLGPLVPSDAAWLGFEGREVTATVDLGTSVDIGSLGLGILRFSPAGIHPPERVECSTSNDGRRFEWLATLRPAAQAAGMRESTRETLLSEPMAGRRARYVRIRAIPPDAIPDGHPAAGHKPWVFIDELFIQLRSSHHP